MRYFCDVGEIKIRQTISCLLKTELSIAKIGYFLFKFLELAFPVNSCTNIIFEVILCPFFKLQKKNNL